MSRNISELHPRLQLKLTELQTLCSNQGITIKIGECLRTAAEQDALYAKGRTTPGSIVTNAKGSSYSSQHQWGIAADFYLDMDIDGDGSKSDDAFNNVTGLFDKTGALAKSIGLGWGGDWKSPVDKPHLYLPDWGNTAIKLKAQYGTPENFKKTWVVDGQSTIITTTQNTPISKKKRSDIYMFECPVLGGGMSGNAVLLWQKLLAGCGYDLGEDGRAGNLSGVFNGGTYIATLDYKKHVGISIGENGDDGTVTAEVWKCMLGL